MTTTRIKAQSIKTIAKSAAGAGLTEPPGLSAPAPAAVRR